MYALVLSCLLGLYIMIWCKSLLVCFSIIHCDAKCFNPAVSAGLCCIYVLLFSYMRVWMGGSGIHYSLKNSLLFISLKFWVIH